MFIYDQYVDMSPIPQTSFLSGTSFAASYSKTGLERVILSLSFALWVFAVFKATFTEKKIYKSRIEFHINVCGFDPQCL